MIANYWEKVKYIHFYGHDTYRTEINIFGGKCVQAEDAHVVK